MGEDVTENNKQEQAIILGELRGQVKELIHSVNNLHSKVDGMGEKVMAVTFLANDIGELKGKTAQLDTRLAVQEALNNQSKGAKDIISMLLTSPLLPWLIFALAVIYTYAKGAGNA